MVRTARLEREVRDLVVEPERSETFDRADVISDRRGRSEGVCTMVDASEPKY